MPHRKKSEQIYPAWYEREKEDGAMNKSSLLTITAQIEFDHDNGSTTDDKEDYITDLTDAVEQLGWNVTGYAVDGIDYSLDDRSDDSDVNELGDAMFRRTDT